MSEVYILQNQDNLFLGKKRAWLDGRELTSLYRTPNKDEAINEMCEVNTKDYIQRIHLVLCPIDAKKLPIIDPEIMPEPLPSLDDEASMPLNFNDNTSDTDMQSNVDADASETETSVNA